MRKNQCITAIKLIIENDFVESLKKEMNEKILFVQAIEPMERKKPFGIYDIFFVNLLQYLYR